jgi:signal transduction histidine kinase
MHSQLPDNRLLIVDDEEGPRKSLEVVFKNQFEIDAVSSGEEAITLSDACPYTVAIVDIRMVGLSGIDVLKTVKQSSPSTEVVILTAYETLETARDAIRHGASDYLSKPFDLHHIREVVNRCRERFLLMTRRDIYLRDKLNRAKNEFLSVLSHELITPMNGVMGYLDFLSETSLDEEQSELVGIIEQSGRQMLETVDDLLDYAESVSRPQSESMDFFNPATLLLELAGRREPVSDDVVIRLDLMPDLPAYVFGPRVEIHMILLKLIDNAVKFTKSGAITVSARRGAGGPVGEEIIFSVSDTGSGLEPEVLESGAIYDPFYQVDGGLTRSVGGLGIGLSLCKKLCENIGSTLDVQSVPGEGSCFSFVVKVRRTPDN